MEYLLRGCALTRQGKDELLTVRQAKAMKRWKGLGPSGVAGSPGPQWPVATS